MVEIEELMSKSFEPQNRRTEEFRTEEVAPLSACHALAGKLVAKTAVVTSAVRNSTFYILRLPDGKGRVQFFHLYPKRKD